MFPHHKALAKPMVKANTSQAEGEARIATAPPVYSGEGVLPLLIALCLVTTG